MMVSPLWGMLPICCRWCGLRGGERVPEVEDGGLCAGGGGDLCGLPMFSGFTLPGIETLFALGLLLGGGRRCER